MSRPFVRGGQRGWAHDEGHERGLFHTYDRLQLGGGPPRKVHVYVPRAVPPGLRLPVVFMHDGHTTFWPGGVAGLSWDVAGLLDEAGGEVAPMIVVAVHPVERDREYTHVDWHHGRRSYGEVADYAAWLADALVPWIDAHYPTLPAPTGRALVGSSHGGLASFWISTRHPDRFGMAGCMSPSFFAGLDSLVHGPGRAALVESALLDGLSPLLSDPARRPRLWICWGLRRDGGDHNRVVEALATLRSAQMVQLLHAHGYDTEEVDLREVPTPGAELYWCEDPHAGHDEPSWRRRLGVLLRTWFPGDDG